MFSRDTVQNNVAVARRMLNKQVSGQRKTAWRENAGWARLDVQFKDSTRKPDVWGTHRQGFLGFEYSVVT
jgi:hypothetical protein